MNTTFRRDGSREVSSRSSSTSNHSSESRRKRKRDSSSSSDQSSSSSSSSSSSTSSSSEEESKNSKKLKKLAKKSRKKEKKKAKKLQKKQEKKDKKHLKKLKKHLKKEKKARKKLEQSLTLNDGNSMNIPAPEVLSASKARAPMTKEEWEKQQSVVRRVYDPETGRHRLVKGSGEILEDCVSREQHLAINKNATRGDGAFFQATIKAKLQNK